MTLRPMTLLPMMLRRPMLALITMACAAALLLNALAAGPALAADQEAARTVRLGGVKVELTNKTRQVVTVKQRSGWHSRVSLWHRAGGDWHRVQTARDGRTG